ncbi:hypothetical protein SISSUDRAFT_1063397 [Sistotremastrum suecicum HHB10207 ss-3]|uniref:F-box domain-containing protein n=1 Tax=Sistotremastrum suecicum HHB10207 ss-3 TaxID=1314776 RepID=A0A166BVK5_9AGAM|nr:hypothetical protein SISSUDRAFT_1063397 [Sistotremastrum suecicum HHB10207 ss-3]
MLPQNPLSGMQRLPLELHYEILRGMKVEDIVSMAQTCRVLRLLICSSKDLFVDAINSSIIALPMGYTMATISAQALHYQAVWSAALSRRLRPDPHIGREIRPIKSTTIKIPYEVHVPQSRSGAVFSHRKPKPTISALDYRMDRSVLLRFLGRRLYDDLGDYNLRLGFMLSFDD